MSKDNNELSRRAFLKGMAVSAAGVTAMGVLAACGTPTPTPPPATEAPVTPTPDPGNWAYEADVVVLGLGGDVARAAIEAHDAGGSVLVIEKQPEKTHYPNTRMSGGVFHNPDPSGDRAARVEYIKAMMRAGEHPRQDGGRARSTFPGCGGNVADKIMEVGGFPHGPGPRSGPGGHDPRRRRLLPHLPRLRGSQVRPYGEVSVQGLCRRRFQHSHYDRPMLTKSR